MGSQRIGNVGDGLHQIGVQNLQIDLALRVNNAGVKIVIFPGFHDEMTDGAVPFKIDGAAKLAGFGRIFIFVGFDEQDAIAAISSADAKTPQISEEMAAAP